MDKPIEVKKNIGFLPETPPLYLDMTVMEYLTFVYELKGCTLNKGKHLKEILDTVKIYDVRNKLIKTLSKGYKQRVGIASAIVGNPKVVILDEPTVGLDPKQIIEVRNLIRILGKSHTVILSSHLLNEVQAVCSRVLIINNGRIIADEKMSILSNVLGQATQIKVKVSGPQREVYNVINSLPGVTSIKEVGIKEGDAFTFVVESKSGIDIRKPLFNALAKKSYPIMGLENTEGELEEMFVKLIDNDRR
jgi:ABC-2 type transport system ATP-binding protein